MAAPDPASRRVRVGDLELHYLDFEVGAESLATIRDAGHFVPMECAAAVADELLG